jgi:aarF domain-containing kinase
MHAGVKVTDLEGLRSVGAHPADVARLVSETFNEMIFVFGDVHADPHPANMMVRRRVLPPGGHAQRAQRADGREEGSGAGLLRWVQWMLRMGRAQRQAKGWELVLLDHGLYRRLSDDFRLAYAGLWSSLILGGEGARMGGGGGAGL